MGEVGRSAFLLDTGTEKIMMDYGTKLREVPPIFPIPVKGRPDVVLLSHAHLDHSGGLAIFESNGSAIPIYTFGITKQFTEMLLYDSLKVSHEEGVKLPFNDTDVFNTIRNCIPIEFQQPFKLKKTEFTAYDAGHIAGSCIFRLQNKGKSLLYTGDFQGIDTHLLKKYDQKIPQSDIVITESTYAQREHVDRKKEEHELNSTVRETLSKGGTCIISGFALQRLQEVLVILDKYGIDYPLYMDGMAKKATTIMNQHKELLREKNALDKALQKTTYITNDKMRKKVLKTPSVVLTTSGMLTGGAVVWYLKRLYEQKNCSLLLTGYQLPETAGKILLETGRFVHKDLNLEIKMFVKRFDFSGHIGKSGLFHFVKRQNPEKVFCIHGDHTEEFAEELREKGFEAVAPIASNRVFQL
jgi:putative mRNA 3-end processing factor